MIVERLHDIEERISAACRRAGRPRADVTMVAVTKTLSAETINEAIRAGITLIGENRVQEYLSKRDVLLPHEFHLIGHLQRNKVKHILPHCTMIESVDSVRLATEIHAQAEILGRPVDVLLEVNVSGEESKHGFRPDAVAGAVAEVSALARVRVRGLMTIATFTDEAEDVRPEFRRMKRLSDDLASAFPELGLHQLSMGMTNDYEVAIEEGATIIRLGTALFGPRIN